MIGQRVVFLEDFEFNGKVYKKGELLSKLRDDKLKELGIY
jgi:hypothetical protein